MQLNQLGCVILPKNLSQAENPPERVAHRGFRHHKSLGAFPNGPPQLVLGSFATLEVGCVISQKWDSENPLERVPNRGFRHHKGLGAFQNGPPPTSPGLICNPGSRVCHFTETGLRKPSEKGCAQDFQTSQMPCGLPKWTPPN